MREHSSLNRRDGEAEREKQRCGKKQNYKGNRTDRQENQSKCFKVRKTGRTTNETSEYINDR